LSGQTTTRLATEDVNSSSVRVRQHLIPNTNLLFNGLGLSPAGQHVRISDMPLKMVIAPDRKAVIAVCAGHNEEGVNIVSLDSRHERQFVSLGEVFNGLVFSADARGFTSAVEIAASFMFSSTQMVKLPWSNQFILHPTRILSSSPASLFSPQPALSTFVTKPIMKSGRSNPVR
jgi:hypothetical protein